MMPLSLIIFADFRHGWPFSPCRHYAADIGAMPPFFLSISPRRWPFSLRRFHAIADAAAIIRHYAD